VEHKVNVLNHILTGVLERKEQDIHALFRKGQAVYHQPGLRPKRWSKPRGIWGMNSNPCC